MCLRIHNYQIYVLQKEYEIVLLYYIYMLKRPNKILSQSLSEPCDSKIMDSLLTWIRGAIKVSSHVQIFDESKGVEISIFAISGIHKLKDCSSLG